MATIYLSNNKITATRGAVSVVKYQIYPCTLFTNEVDVISSNESIVSVDSIIGQTISLRTHLSGEAIVKVKSKSDESLTAVINVCVTDEMVEPNIYNVAYDGKKVTIILEVDTSRLVSNVQSYKTLVDFGWDAEKEVDMEVQGNRVSFEVPEYDVDYYVRLSYSDGVNKSHWVTKKIRASIKTQEEIDKELKDKIQMSGISLTVSCSLEGGKKYKILAIGENVDSIEYTLSWESADNLHLVPWSNNSTFPNQMYFDVECPDEFTQYHISIRGLNNSGKRTEWKNLNLAELVILEVNPSSMSLNLDNGFFTVFENTALVEEGIVETSLSIGEVYHSPRAGMDSELLNVPIKIITPETDERNAIGEVIDGGGESHSVVLYDEILSNCYNLKSLCYENCLGRDFGGFMLFNESSKDVACIKKNTVIRRDNFAVAGIVINNKLFPLAGFRLLQDVKIYSADNIEVASLKKGNWVWLTGRSATLPNGDTIIAGEPNPSNYPQMAITSYSKEPICSEISRNVAYDSVYFMDTYFNLGRSAYAIDTTRLSDRKLVGKGEVANGFFDFENYGDPALLWSGSKYAIRSSIDNTNVIENNNVLGYMHQCYLMTTSTGENISQAKVGSACVWTEIKNALDVMELSSKFKDRHRVEEYYYTNGYFDTQEVQEGYFMGEKYIAACSEDCRHSQNSEHKSGPDDIKITENGQKQEMSEHIDTVYDENHNPLLDRKNLVGISNSVLGSFFPFLQYIAKRIRAKCVEATGQPINFLDVLCSAYNSNFAVYNDPVNGVRINNKISYRPLYGVKVLQDNIYLYVQQSMTNKALIIGKNTDNEPVLLSKGDWVWFSEDYPPKIANLNKNCLSIVGYTRGTDEEGNPAGAVLMNACYVHAGLSNVKQDDVNLSTIDSILNMIGIDTDKRSENDISHNYSALHYNIATMANPDGNEPHLLYEDDYYGRVINNTLCFNNRANEIHVTREDGTAETIKPGRLFTFIGEYTVENIKYSRVYYYSDLSLRYEYGSIETPAAALFDYYIMNTNTNTVTVNGENYGLMPLPTVTEIYTRYGELYAKTEVREKHLDAVLFKNTINYKKVSEGFNLLNIPNYIAKGGLGEVDDTIHGLKEVNESLMEAVTPNFLAIEYYVYNSYESILVKQRLKGYVKLDFSLDYSRKIK